MGDNKLLRQLSFCGLLSQQLCSWIAKDFPRGRLSQGLQFTSVQSLDRLGRRGIMRDDSAEIFFRSLLAGGHCEQFRHGQGYLLF